MTSSIMYNFFGVGTDFDKYKDNKSMYNILFLEFGKYLGCRFSMDVFDKYMKCISYWSWDSSEMTNFLLEHLSGNWYEKFHDVDHK